MKYDMPAHDHSTIGHKKQGTQFTCTSHPEVISDKPGKCPKFGMELVLKEGEADHKQMVISNHEKIIWTHLTNVLLGVFLLMAPVTFGYKSSGMLYSDLISGALLVVFGLLSLNPFRLRDPWAACFTEVCLHQDSNPADKSALIQYL